MIVITMSLDSMLAPLKNSGNITRHFFKNTLFTEFDRVVLITQDMENLTEPLTGIEHVPCAFSQSKSIRWLLSRFTYLRWAYYFFYSFFWMLKHRRQIKLLVSRGADSPAPFFSMLFHIPYVLYYHYDVAFQVTKINKRPVIGRLLRVLERFAFRRANSVFLTSPSLMAKAKSFGAKRIRVIPNWIAFEELEGPQPSKRSDEFHILFIGRLHPVKQVDVLIRAFHLLHKRNPNMNLYVLGDGEQRASLIKLTHDLNLSDCIHFMGYVNQKTVFQMMRQSDVLVLPSKMEGMPRVLIEAMIHKVPIVATNVPGIREMVEHGKTGYLIDHANPTDLARGIEYILKNKEDAASLAECAYLFAKQNFSKERVLQQLVSELTAIVPEYSSKNRVLSPQPFRKESLATIPLSVVIPAFNAERTLEQCLTSVLDALPSNKEIIVVDDASTDNTVKIASKFPVQLIRHRTRSGSTTTRNDGLKHASRRFVALIDSDVILLKDSLINLLSAFTEDSIENVGGVGGVAIPLKSTLVSDSYTVRLFGQSAIDHRIKEVESIGSGFAIYDRKLLERLGYFDESYFYGGEDYDLNLRLRKAGYKLLVVPSSKIYHDHPATLSGLAKKWFSYGFTFFEVCRRNHLTRQIVLTVGWPIVWALLLFLALLSNQFIVWGLFLMAFCTPWLIYYSTKTVRFWLFTQKIKHLALPFVHQVMIVSRTMGFLYAALKALRRNGSISPLER